MSSTVVSPIIVALDFASAATALAFARQLDPHTVRLKVGKELFVAEGPKIIEELQALGFEIFLDLKFHDIPNTVAQACAVAATLGVWMTNVHASGGGQMMQHVMSTLATKKTRPLVTAVTVLTSMGVTDLQEIGLSIPVDKQVLHLAQLTQKNGLDGVVCSAHEARELRQALGEGFLLVTPGIRLSTDSDNDQHRIMTPEKALAAGADYLVIGRPITQAKNPDKRIEQILQKIQHN